MSKEEAKRMKRTGVLGDPSGDLVPVFDSPGSVEQRIYGMGKEALRNMFRGLGVRDPYSVAFFETGEPAVGPIPQRAGGLREYKLEPGTPIRVCSTKRV
ncbi:MAG: hypothetical protein IIA87_01600 [Nanoarchaeota archaeon]|nr:hypothetical protein [Nanoarchaeota archaeon]